jgi:hypothetical protein
MPTKPRAVSAAIEPMSLDAIRERLELFREFGVKSAAFYGPHLTEVVFAAQAVAETGEEPTEMGANEPEQAVDALTRLASRGEKRLNREE